MEGRKSGRNKGCPEVSLEGRKIVRLEVQRKRSLDVRKSGWKGKRKEGRKSRRKCGMKEDWNEERKWSIRTSVRKKVWKE